MTQTFRRVLLALSAITLLGTLVIVVMQWTGATGPVLEDGGGPVWGDFINLWTAGRMVIDGQSPDIYNPATFVEYQQTLVSEDIGWRLWAYPPHSLLLALPFGFLGYWAALSIWSILGLVLLAYGARRFGFDRIETIILVLSPASLMCLLWGQTGNLAVGLLLLTLSERHDRDPVSIGSVGLLTIKPQLGFMIPFLWAFNKRWKLIALSATGVVILGGVATSFLGLDVWDGYLNETIPLLNEGERNGTGQFQWMIPSFFMAARILTGDGDLAANIHVVLAAGVLVVVLFHLRRSKSHEQQVAVLLVGTATITPYVHVYDLSMLLAAAFLVARVWARGENAARTAWGERAVVMAWGLPLATFGLNAIGAPIGPLLLLGLLALAIKAPAESEMKRVRVDGRS